MMFEVIVTNDIVGNSTRIMSYEQIIGFNNVVKVLADKCKKDGCEHSYGMWTVKPYKESNHDK